MRHVGELRRQLARHDETELARKAGADVVADGLEMWVWETAVFITTPDFIAYSQQTDKPLDPMTQALIAYYLNTTDGTEISGQWIAFTELPDGRFYTAAFQGYTGQELAQHFGNDIERFRKTAVAVNGQFIPFADAAFRFQVFPHVPLLISMWLGDEDFPPSYNILFDAYTCHHLPTDACAIIGGIITGKLLREGKSS